MASGLPLRLFILLAKQCKEAGSRANRTTNKQNALAKALKIVSAKSNALDVLNLLIKTFASAVRATISPRIVNITALSQMMVYKTEQSEAWQWFKAKNISAQRLR